MIVGVGIDIVDVTRIERLLRKYGDQFARRILASAERPAFAASSRPVWFLANRFAAKEALSKALGTGLRYPVTLHAISVTSDVSASRHWISMDRCRAISSVAASPVIT